MKQTIERFYQDEEGDWVAVLSCGHTQHMRHRPPFINRPGVITESGRRQMLGKKIPCPECDIARL
jgi:hypothetical protein